MAERFCRKTYFFSVILIASLSATTLQNDRKALIRKRQVDLNEQDELSNEPYRSPSNPFATEFFHHRAYHSSAAVGGYLWIDGGEIATWNGTGNVSNSPSFSTYSINLSRSWTNATIGLNSIIRPQPALASQTLWVDPSETFLYAYGGGISHFYPQSSTLAYPFNNTPPINQILKLVPSGDSGTWSQLDSPSTSNFSTLVRSRAAITASGGELGFALGGVMSASTTSSIPSSWVPVPGLVMYNMTSQEWYNISDIDYAYVGGAADGAAHFVPSFGYNGLLFIFGGTVANGTTLPSTDSLWIFDPSTQRWSSQEVSGTKPSQAVSPCVVGAQGDNNTYEIFLYGGRAANVQDTLAQGSVYVLSLPAFHWEKQNVASQLGRYQHTCNVIGRRQMVVVGGRITNGTELTPITLTSLNGFPSLPDPWEQGLGIFDLSSMEWREGYDADAAPYVTPTVIKNYYHENGRYPAVWSNPIIKDWFGPTVSARNTTDSSAASPTLTDHPPSASFAKPIPTISSTPSSKSSKDIGSIVGGTVGGAAALGFVASLVYFTLRRKRFNNYPETSTSQDPGSKPSDASSAVVQNTWNYPTELQAVHHPCELPQREVATSELHPWAMVEAGMRSVYEL
ncbi:hypothetical protein ACLMJK_000588 [Lecanora helva]